jgi:hypothetical protein
MPLPERYYNNLSFNLTTALTSSSDHLTPPSYVGYDTSGQTRMVVDNQEIILVDLSQQPWPITRGLEGTTAAGHGVGALCQCRVTAGSLQNLNPQVGVLLDPSHDEHVEDPDGTLVFDPDGSLVVDPYLEPGTDPEPILDPSSDWIYAPI